MHPMPPRTLSDPAILTPGTLLATDDLTQAARVAWQTSGLTQVAAAEKLGVNRVTFAQAVGEPERGLGTLRVRIIEALTTLRITGPLFRVEAGARVVERVVEPGAERGVEAAPEAAQGLKS